MDEGAKVMDLAAGKVALGHGAEEGTAQRRATLQQVVSDSAWRRTEALEQARLRWTPEARHDETLEELAAIKLLTSAALRAPTATERMAALDQISARIDAVVRTLRGRDNRV